MVVEDEKNLCFVSSVLKSSMKRLFGDETEKEEPLAIEAASSSVEEDDREFLGDVS
jgi:hypothetical protein